MPLENLDQFQNHGAPVKDGLEYEVAEFLFEKLYTIFEGEDWDGNKASGGERVEAAFTVLGNLSGGKGGKGGSPKYNPKIKSTNSTQVKVNANSKSSTKAQTTYRIKNTQTGKYVKPGITSGKVRKDGVPYRATKQANKWNKEAGKPIYKAEKTSDIPAGPGARQKALDYEKQDAEQLIKEGHLNEPDKHKTPR